MLYILVSDECMRSWTVERRMHTIIVSQVATCTIVLSYIIRFLM